jgi:hypothetical protein
LPDHPVVSDPTGVGCDTSAANFGLKHTGQAFEERQVSADAAAGYDKPLSLGYVDSALERAAHDTDRPIRLGQLDWNLFHPAPTGYVRLGPGEDTGADGGHLGSVGRTFNGSENALAETGHFSNKEVVFGVNAEVSAVSSQPSPETHGEATCEVPAIGRRGEEEDVGLVVSDQAVEDLRVWSRRVRIEERMLGDEHFVCAEETASKAALPTPTPMITAVRDSPLSSARMRARPRISLETEASSPSSCSR